MLEIYSVKPDEKPKLLNECDDLESVDIFLERLDEDELEELYDGYVLLKDTDTNKIFVDIGFLEWQPADYEVKKLFK